MALCKISELSGEDKTRVIGKTKECTLSWLSEAYIKGLCHTDKMFESQTIGVAIRTVTDSSVSGCLCGLSVPQIHGYFTFV